MTATGTLVFLALTASVPCAAQEPSWPSGIDPAKVFEGVPMKVPPLALSPAPGSRLSEETIDKWIADLNADSYDTREKASEKLIEAYSPELGERLRARLASAPDFDAEKQLERVLHKGQAKALERILERKTLLDFPYVADLAVSRNQAKLLMLIEIIGGVRDQYGHYSEAPLSNERDRNILAQALIDSLDSSHSDWRELNTHLKRRLIYLCADPAITAGQAGVENRLALTTDADPDIRKHAIITLLRNELDEKTEKAVVEALKSQDWKERLWVVINLISYERLEQAPLILDLAKNDPNPQVRWMCYSFIEKFLRDDQRGIAAILYALEKENRNLDLVAHVIYLLEQWHLADAYADKIRPFIDDPNPRYRNAARGALGLPLD